MNDWERARETLQREQRLAAKPVDTSWRARRRARIERVATGPLRDRPRATPAQLRRRRVTPVGCFLALVLALAVAAELRDGDDSAPQTALRPEGPLPGGGIVSDDGTADEEFADGDDRDGSFAGEKLRRDERRARGRKRVGSDGAVTSGGSLGSGRSATTDGPPL